MLKLFAFCSDWVHRVTLGCSNASWHSCCVEKLAMYHQKVTLDEENCEAYSRNGRFAKRSEHTVRLFTVHGDSTDRDNSRVPTFFAQGVCHFYFGLEELIELAVMCCANLPFGLFNEFGVIAYVSTELKEAYFFQLYYSVSRGG